MLSAAAALICAVTPLPADAVSYMYVPQTTLHEFGSVLDPSNQGAYPFGRLAQGSDGDFYGVLLSTGDDVEGGAIFRMTPSGAIKLIYNFADSSVPDHPYEPTSVVIGNDGNFYGTTGFGGTGMRDDGLGGVIFKLTPRGDLTVLHNFSGPDGASDTGTLTQGPDGTLFGATPYGGIDNQGVIYSCTLDGKFTVLHQFDNESNPADGYYPQGEPILGKDGALYGTTAVGGATRGGIVYRLTLDGTETVLHTFFEPNTGDGASPSGALAQDQQGTLYGTTYGGGTSGSYGTIFKINPDGAGYKILYNFTGSADNDDGANPLTGLTLGSDGNFYGVTYRGGISPTDHISAIGYGTAFQVTPSGQVTILHHFSADEAYNPQQPLVQGHNGDLYSSVSNYNGSGGSLYKLRTTLPPSNGSVTGFALNESVATGGSDNPDATITLDEPAGPGGVQVHVMSETGGIASVEPYAFVPEGLTTAHVGVYTGVVSSVINATLDVNGQTDKDVHVKVTPSIRLLPITVDNPNYQAGSGVTPMLNLMFYFPAPKPYGEDIHLTTSDSNAADVPVTVHMQPGESSLFIPITSHSIRNSETVKITANAGGASYSVLLFASK